MGVVTYEIKPSQPADVVRLTYCVGERSSSNVRDCAVSKSETFESRVRLQSVGQGSDAAIAYLESFAVEFNTAPVVVR